MPKRIVRITSTASIKAHHACLAIEHDDAIASIPFRDISVVVIESQQATISTAALSALFEAGAVVVHCDTKHMPSGIALPFASNFRHAAVSKAQLAMPRPLQKRIWQRIVRAKIENQARVLDILGLAGAAVRGIGQYVQSGDTTNREAVAAATYFRKLLPNGGRRESSLSPALDYGYAEERKSYATFRKFLLNNGYRMEQFSVYTRVVLSREEAEMHKRLLRANLPLAGAVDVLIVTEKQYAAREVLVNTRPPKPRRKDIGGQLVLEF